MDKIISYINTHNDKNITLLYSTPSVFIDALRKDKVEWNVKYDDHFPYADIEDNYWTAFFSTRATKKRETKDLSGNLHASNKLFSIKALREGTTNKEMEPLMKAKYDYQDIQGVY